MINTSKKYNLKFILKSPLHIGTGNRENGYDKIMQFGNTPIIPASTIKGKMRDNFRKLTISECINNFEESKPCSCITCKIFGSKGFNPSKILFQDLVAQINNNDTSTINKNISLRTGTAIDRYRKVNKNQSLFTKQIVENCTFKGNFEVYFNDETLKYEKELLLSVKMIEAIGGSKSRGLGFVKVEVSEIECS